MIGATGKAAPQSRGVGYLALALAIALAGCAPVSDPSAGLSPQQSIELIEQSEPSEIALEAVAEAFALGTRATDVQRENITAHLVGHRVEWDIPVYEVSYSEGRYEVTSQPIPIQDPEATPLIRVVAFVIPRSASDDALLQAVKADDVIHVRGIVQEIRLRTIVAIVPATVASSAESVDRESIANSNRE